MVYQLSDMLMKPKDDWEHEMRKRPLVIDGQAFRWNTFNPGMQMASQFQARYVEPGVWQAHWWRFQGIQAFVEVRREDLIVRGLIEVDSDSSGEVHHPALYDVLCATQLRDIAPDGDVADIFPPDVIDRAVARAHELGDFGPQ